MSFHYYVVSAFVVLAGVTMDYCLIGCSYLRSSRGYSKAMVATSGPRLEPTLPPQRRVSILIGYHSQRDIKMS
jgi:hypothetical protein